MEFPYIAASVGGFLLFLQQFLMMNTGSHRAKVEIGVGTGGDLHLERKSRRHGNLAENAAIFIIVLALTELLTGGGTVVMAFAGVFVLARISHAIGFMSTTGSHATSDGPKFFVLFRMIGAMGTGLVGMGLGLYLGYLILISKGLIG